MDDQPVDAVDVLTAQHAEIRALFDATIVARGAGKVAAFADLVRLVAIHETVEQQVIHPLARHTIDGGEAIVDARLVEEAAVKVAFAELDGLGCDHPEFDTRLTSARDDVLAHSDSEEVAEFGPLRAAVPDDILRDHVLAIRRAEVATPTPAAASAPAAPSPAGAVFDHVRDVLRPR